MELTNDTKGQLAAVELLQRNGKRAYAVGTYEVLTEGRLQTPREIADSAKRWGRK